MPKEIIFILAGLLIATWFLLGENKTFWEKLGIIFTVVAIYAAFRYISGVPMEDIFAPIFGK